MSGADEHRVHLPESHLLVLTLARCRCGWQYGYDASSRQRAIWAAHAHVQDTYLDALEARQTGTIDGG